MQRLSSTFWYKATQKRTEKSSWTNSKMPTHIGSAQSVILSTKKCLERGNIFCAHPVQNGAIGDVLDYQMRQQRMKKMIGSARPAQVKVPQDYNHRGLRGALGKNKFQDKFPINVEVCVCVCVCVCRRLKNII